MSVKKYFIYVGVAIYCFLIPLLFFSYIKTPKFLIQTDVISFLTGAKIIRDGKTASLYNIDTQYEYQNLIVSPDKKKLLPFRNFPITAVAYIPLLNMDLKSSYIAVFVINVFLLGIFTFLALYFFPNLRKNIVFYLLPFFFWPSVNNLIVGQYTLLTLLIFMAIYILLKKEKSFCVGFLTSVLAMKPQFLLFTPFSFVLSTDKKKYIIGFMTGMLIFVVINLAIVGNMKPFFNYSTFLLNTESPNFGSRPYQMYTLYGMVKQIFPKTNTDMFTAFNIFLYFFSTIVLLKKRTNYSPKAFFSMGIFITILFSVHALTHDLLLMLIPIYLYSASDLKDRRLPLLSYSLFFMGLTTLVPVSFPTTLIIFSLLLFVFLHDKYSHTPEHHKYYL